MQHGNYNKERTDSNTLCSKLHYFTYDRTSCLRETMLLSFIHDERLYYVFKRFFLFPVLNVLKVFYFSTFYICERKILTT